MTDTTETKRSTKDIIEINRCIYSLNREIGALNSSMSGIKWVLGINISFSIGILSLLISRVI